MLLINPQETQMVRSLGVKIGGREVPAQPLEMLQTHLVRQPTTIAPMATAVEDEKWCSLFLQAALVQETRACAARLGG